MKKIINAFTTVALASAICFGMFVFGYWTGKAIFSLLYTLTGDRALVLAIVFNDNYDL